MDRGKGERHRKCFPDGDGKLRRMGTWNGAHSCAEALVAGVGGHKGLQTHSLQAQGWGCAVPHPHPTVSLLLCLRASPPSTFHYTLYFLICLKRKTSSKWKASNQQCETIEQRQAMAPRPELLLFKRRDDGIIPLL